MLVSFERDRLREFEEYCTQSKISVSQGVRELLEEFLEKKALGESREPNPCHISYITYTTHQEKPSQSDLRDWLPRTQAIKRAKILPFSSGEWSHIAETFNIIAQKKRTGYL